METGKHSALFGWVNIMTSVFFFQNSHLFLRMGISYSTLKKRHFWDHKGLVLQESSESTQGGSCFIVSCGNFCPRYLSSTVLLVHQKDPRRSWKDLIAATANEVFLFYCRIKSSVHAIPFQRNAAAYSFGKGLGM